MYIDIFKKTSPNSQGLKEILANWEEKISCFEFVYVNDNKDHSTNPGALEFCIKDTNEKAYQRAFFRHEKIKIKGKLEFSPLDIEIPVVRNRNSRRRSLDLIGETIGTLDRGIVIVELKASRGTSPVWGIWELVKYALSANENAEKLKYHQKFNIGQEVRGQNINYWREKMPIRYLILAAPNPYWETWSNYLKKFRTFGDNILKQNNLNLNAELIFASFPETDFKKQKGNKEKYIPEVPNGEWELV